MSDETVKETVEATAAAQANAWAANIKALFEQLVTQNSVQQAQRSRDADRERENQNDWHAFSLEQARQNQQIVNRLAQDATTISARLAAEGANFSAAMQAQQVRSVGNQGTIDNVVLMDGVTNLKAAQIARDSMMSDVAMDLKNTAGAAIDASEAAQTAATAAQATASGFGVVSSPVPQGTTGVAQAGLQTGYSASIESMMASNAVATNAILAQISKLAEIVGVLTLKVAGDVVVAE